MQAPSRCVKASVSDVQGSGLKLEALSRPSRAQAVKAVVKV